MPDLVLLSCPGLNVPRTLPVATVALCCVEGVGLNTDAFGDFRGSLFSQVRGRTLGA